MESAHHSLPRPDCNSTADLSLCARLFRQSHVFLICVVLTYNDSKIIPGKFEGIVSVNDLWFPRRLQGTSLGSSGSPGKFLFYTGMIVSTVLPNLVPPRHIDDSSLRILWSAVIKSPKCSTLGTTVPVRLLQEALVIFLFKHMSQIGLRKVRIYTVLARTQFHFCSRLHWKFMRWTWSVSTSKLRVFLPKALL